MVMSWHAQKGSKNYFCIISGGYVLSGELKDITKIPDANKTKSSTLDEFESQKEQHAFLKKHFSEEIHLEVEDRVRALLEERNKATTSPSNS